MATRAWRRKPSKRAVTKEAMVALGTELKRLRTRSQTDRPKGLSQREVAEMLDVSSAYVSQIERGTTIVSLRILRRLASIYGVLPPQLLRILGLQEFDWLSLSQPREPQAQEDPFSQLGEEERQELISYLTFIRLKRGVFL